MKNSLIDGLDFVGADKNFTHYGCHPEEFNKVIFLLGIDFSYIWLLGIYQHRENGKVKLQYFFYDFEQEDKFTISYFCEEGGTFHSVSRYWKNAKFFEREIILQTGLKFHEKYRFKQPDRDFHAHLPIFTLESQSNLQKNLDQIHLTLDNETVVHSAINRGEYAIGLEQILERSTVAQWYEVLESYYPIRGSFYAHLISHALETYQAIEIPDRAKGIRMVLLEFQRITSHLFYLEHLASEFNNSTFLDHIRLCLKRVQSLLISYSGNEFGNQLIRFGGVVLDTNQTWTSRVISELMHVEQVIGQVANQLLNITKNEQVLQYELVSKEDVFSWSLTGPLARAAGVNLDLRERSELYFYTDVNFEIPVGVNGTIYDLISVKLQEIVQSGQIIIQVLDNLPTGDFQLSNQSELFTSREITSEVEYRKSVKHFLEFEEFDISQCIEAPRGLLGLNLFKKSQEQRFRFLNSNFCHGDYIESFLKGKKYEEVLPIWSAMNIDLKEIER